MLLDAILTGLCAVAIMFFGGKIKDKIKRKKIWVIDDSQSDLMLYKINLQLSDCDVRYFDSVKDMALEVLKGAPDGAIVDYRLKDNVDGDEVFKFFEANDIRCILATGHEGDILGVDKSKIIIKSAEPSFYRTLESMIRRETA